LVATDEKVKPFDENAAIEELERLLHAIQTARQEKQRKIDEFQAFVQTFRRSDAGGAAAAPAAPPLPLQPVLESPEPAAAPIDDRPAAVARRSPRRQIRALVLVGGVVGVIVLVLLLIRLQRPAPVQSAAQRQAPASVVRTEPAAAAPAATPPAAAPAAAPARPVEVELRTVRPVWMRVTVDGRKDLERIVPGGERLHFGADRSIAVRAGNGADVLEVSGGRETPLGVEGQPITRTFAPRP
jgi:hypothetical protein